MAARQSYFFPPFHHEKGLKVAGIEPSWWQYNTTEISASSVVGVSYLSKNGKVELRTNFIFHDNLESHLFNWFSNIQFK